MKFTILTRKGKVSKIEIDESAKEDFKQLMNWSEEEFNYYTVVKEKR